MPREHDETAGAETGYWQAGLDPARARIARGRRILAVANRLSPRLAGWLALRWFGTVRKYPLPGREREWLETAERLTIPSECGPLAAVTWNPEDAETGDTEVEAAPTETAHAGTAHSGKAPPAVLLAHGWEGRASQMGAIGTALAAAGYRALAVEPPGHGDTGGKRSSLLRFAQAVEAAVAAEGPFAGFVGHSFGIAGAAFAVQRGRLAWRQIAERLVFLCPAADLHRFMAAVWEALGLEPPATDAFVAGLERHIGYDWQRARRGAVLTATDLPLLVLHDHDDRDTPIAEAEEVAAAWPRGELVASCGLGHRRILRAPETIERIVDFTSD